MPITVHIPGPLRQFTEGRIEVQLHAPADTLREALDHLGSLYPGIRDRILTEQGAVREHINIFVGNEDVRYTGGLLTRLPAAAVITVVPAISGGECTAGLVVSQWSSRLLSAAEGRLSSTPASSSTFRLNNHASRP